MLSYFKLGETDSQHHKEKYVFCSKLCTYMPPFRDISKNLDTLWSVIIIVSVAFK